MIVNESTQPQQSTTLRIVGLTALLLVVFWIVLRLLGRTLVTESGFGVWTGAWTPQTSQWMADPYSFTHVLHGVIFYFLLLPTARWISLGYRFLIASLLEAGWEVLENTSYVINLYRSDTAALNYFGDSILNSTFDLIAAMAGFWFAASFNWRWAVGCAIIVELLLAYFIRDNLTLNILMFIYPSEAIKNWQLAGQGA